MPELRQYEKVHTALWHSQRNSTAQQRINNRRTNKPFYQLHTERAASDVAAALTGSTAVSPSYARVDEEVHTMQSIAY